MTEPVVQPTSFPSGSFDLDAFRHEPAEVRGAAVVAHPHPAHGGNMDHPVVVLTAERLAAAGLLTLRFDFRGVRRSEGDVNDHAGHQEDVRAACRAVRHDAPDGPFLGAGFSYGARMFASVVEPESEDRPPVTALLLLAPATKVPRTSRDFGNLLMGRPLDEATHDAFAAKALSRIPVRTRVLVGDRDVVAPHEELADVLAPASVLGVLEGLNHFFSRGRGASATASDVLQPALDKAIEALT